MTPITAVDSDFEFEGIPAIQDAVVAQAATAHAQPQAPPGAGPLGPLAQLPGTWKGTGFNTIWRPHQPGQDRFLELNLTDETLVFTEIHGKIPNRGLLMHDINLRGITYMQQISEANGGPGLHVEPGIWVHVPPTSAPQEPATVARLASIPHGTTILAQGTTQFLEGGPPHIPDNNIIPFPIGGQPGSFAQAEQDFPELNLAHNTQFRHMTNGVTQAMVKNPNSVLQAALQGKPMKSRTFLQITTKNQPIKGGGTSNTAFLAAGNANAVEVDATFWIQTLPGAQGHPDILQLQYTQLVNLNFNGLTWPHVTVATLRKQ